MLRYNTKVTAEERQFLDAIHRVEYGEIYSPKLKPGALDQEASVSENARDLLNTVREGTEISILTIHAGEPVYAEVDQVIGGFRCRKKVKFPTV